MDVYLNANNLQIWPAGGSSFCAVSFARAFFGAKLVQGFIFAQAEGSAMAHFEGLWSGSYWAAIDRSVLAWSCGELQGAGP